MSEYSQLLDELRQQEEELQFSTFSNETGLQLGLALLEAARDASKPVAIDITRHGLQLFHHAMEGTGVDNGEWIRRKNNVVNRFGHSSYFVGISLKSAGQTMEEKYLVSSQEYAAHGGAFPIILRGTGAIGTITVSGLPQEEDHKLVTSTIRTFLQKQG
jgi:uncharacterized protein (UPF0303 family)